MAEPEVRAEPEELARASQVYLDESQALFAALRALRAGAPVQTSDLGTVEQAGDLASAHDRVLGLAGTLYERLIAVLEQDADNLLRVAFAYEEADRIAAESVQRPIRGAF